MFSDYKDAGHPILNLAFFAKSKIGKLANLDHAPTLRSSDLSSGRAKTPPRFTLGMHEGLRNIWVSRPSRNQLSNGMAFPHPQSRNDHERNEHEPSWRSVVGKVFKRAVDIAEDRNGKEDVNPAKNRTLRNFS